MDISTFFYLTGTIFFILLIIILAVFFFISIKAYLNLKRSIQNFTDTKLLVSAFSKSMASPIKILLLVAGFLLAYFKQKKKI